jgi:hypothetical protein
MKISYISNNYKRLNSALIVTLLISIMPWLIIFPLIQFTENEMFVNILTILSLFGIVSSIITILLKIIFLPKITLSENFDYELQINSEKLVSEISIPKDIKYCGNFLINKTLNHSLEINQKVAFDILINKRIKISKTIIELKNVKFLEESPLTILDKLLQTSWAAS